MYPQLENRDEINIWLSTYHEALKSPFTSNLNMNCRVTEFATQCADDAIKELKQRSYDQRLYDECDV